jgi:hypothetical protein
MEKIIKSSTTTLQNEFIVEACHLHIYCPRRIHARDDSFLKKIAMNASLFLSPDVLEIKDEDVLTEGSYYGKTIAWQATLFYI